MLKKQRPKVFILHHHMDPGGVTHVIHSQVSALLENDPPFQVELILGSALKPPTLLKKKQIHINSLINYLSVDLSAAYLKKAKSKIKTFLKSLIKGNALLHIHNLNLGKNPLLNIVIWELCNEGVQIVNHCHDFAEDGRTFNYNHLKNVIQDIFKLDLDEVLYPTNNNYKYLVINSRDYKILKRNLPNESVILFPNPVSIPEKHKISKKEFSEVRNFLQIPTDKKIFFYPVRGIKRKNLGELILMGALFREHLWVHSLAPRNPNEIPYYNGWEKFVERYKLPVKLGVGSEVNFEALYQASYKIFSTSIVEGFGMVFLEPWLYGKSLAGRRIPGITDDFLNMGIKMNLYDGINIPISWIGTRGEFVKKYFLYQKKDYRNFGIKAPMDLEKQIEKNKISKSHVDFASLNIPMQKMVIEKIIRSKKLAQSVIDKNQLKKLIYPMDRDQINVNSRIVKNKLSLKAFGKKMVDFYKVTQSENLSLNLASHESSKVGSICKSFLEIDNCYLLRK